MLLHSKINENDDNKISINDLCKQIKVMRPGAVMQFVAKQFGMSSTEFVAKYAASIAKMAIKNGWVKTKDIGASIADFSKKNKEDVTGIDFSKAEIDPSTTKFKCLFDNVGDKLSTFMKDLENELKDEGKEIEKADKQLHDDVKKAGIKMEEQEIDDNGIAVASVIDNKKNKGKSGKELKKKIESAIKKDKQAKEIQKISKELKKASSKVKVDKKYEKMSDEELAKLDDKINKKIRNRSGAAKKNDAFRIKIKNAVQKGVAEDFKKSVKTAYVSTDKLKKSITSSMKSGLAVEQIKEPRAVCISVQCGEKDFGNVLKEADDSAKIIDVTDGSKDESIQKVIDYIKKVLQDKIGKDKLGKKTYAYLKNAGGNCLLYVFAGVKQDKLDESLLNEDLLNEDKALADVVGGKLISTGFSKIKDIAQSTSIDAIHKAADALENTLVKPDDIGIHIDFETKTLEDGWAQDIASAARKFATQEKIYDTFEKAGKLTASTFYDFHAREQAFQQGVAIALNNAKKYADAEDLKEITRLAKKYLGENAADVDEWISDMKDQGILDSKGWVNNKLFNGIKDGISNAAAKAATDIASTTADPFLPKGVELPSFNYHNINTELRELNNVFSDGKIDANEMQKIAQFGDKLKSYSKWATEHQNINNPFVQTKIAEIKALSEDYHYMLEDNKDALDSAAAAASDARTGATEATRAASKEMANDEEVKKAAGGWKEKLGLDKAFTALGWARLAAKTTGIVLNNGKAIVDALGAAAVKFKEDANVIAQMNFLLTNGEGNDAKFQDSKFSVRFSTNDMKWHATCLDDRKMKFDEDELIKKALGSEEGKKFKAACLKKWTSIFKPKDETRQVIPYIMKNFEKIGLKASDSNVNKIVDTVQKMEDNFSTIEKQFK